MRKRWQRNLAATKFDGPLAEKIKTNVAMGFGANCFYEH
jgi:hypothetical protein